MAKTRTKNDRPSIPVLVDGPSIVCRNAYASAMESLRIAKRHAAPVAFKHYGNNETFVVPGAAGKGDGGDVILTGGLYSSIRSLLSILKQIYPGCPDLGPVIVFYDHGRHPLRARLFPGYKDNRRTDEKMGEKERKQIRQQVDKSRDFFRALGCRVVRMRNREADDCIAQVVEMIAGGRELGLFPEDALPFVVSGDRDLYQLHGKARVYDLNHNEVVTATHFKKRFAVPPAGFVYYKAITGDKSDNIPGIAGVGDKTAAAFVTRFVKRIPPHLDPPEAVGAWLRSIDPTADGLDKRSAAILENCNHVQKVCSAVSLHAPGFTGKRLARLRRRVSRARAFDADAFGKLCREYKFKSLRADVDVEPMFTAINGRRFEL